jgi:alkanesulfonate monooxygenase SsuD/methylene tetrahydromethanopterin reductase-like flavin-dependent oxidoreductase (luciferase family)
VYLPPFGPFGDPNVLVDLAVRAEDAGWDGVFLWDHVATEAPPIADTWTSLGAMAQVTERVELGATVTPLPRRRPWVVARQASTVSRLSHGRLIFGTGLGSDESGDFTRFGETTDLSTRAAMLTEGLEIMRAMWSGRPLQHVGRHYNVTLDETAPEPHPIPIWMANSNSNASVLRRAATCDGIFAHAEHTFTPDEVAVLMTQLDLAGRPQDRSYDVAIAGNASPAWMEPMNIDLKGLAEAGATWWMESLMHFDPLELSLRVIDAGPPSS